MTEEGRAAECLAALARTGAPTRTTRLLAATGSLFCSCVEGASKFQKDGQDVRGVFPGFFPRDLEIAFVARFMMCLEDLKNADTQDQVL